MTVSAWVVCGPSMTNAYRTRFEAENADPPEDYNGPMDDRSYAIMSSMEDITTAQGFYQTKQVQGQSPFTLYGMNFPDEQTCIDDLDYLDAQWPGNQIEIESAWYWDTGLPLGQSYDEGIIIGDPVYPLNPTTWELMPARVGATSNADLQDINLVLGQNPRLFNPSEVTVLRANGDITSAALIRLKGNWGPGRIVRLRIAATNGGAEERDFEFTPSDFMTALEAAEKLAERIDESILFTARVNEENRVIIMRPEAPTHRFSISVLQ